MQNQTADINLIDAFERIPVKIFPDLQQGSRFAAAEVARLIREKQARNETCVLGLATGSTPKTLYAELVRMHREEGLSFKNVVTFNLDEYYPIDQDALLLKKRNTNPNSETINTDGCWMLRRTKNKAIDQRMAKMGILTSAGPRRCKKGSSIRRPGLDCICWKKKGRADRMMVISTRPVTSFRLNPVLARAVFQLSFSFTTTFSIDRAK